MSYQINAFQNDAFQHVDVVPGPSASGGPSGKNRRTQTAGRRKQTGKSRTSTGTQRQT